MPRNGAGIYSTPLGTDGISDQTIESTKYNGNTHDVEQDLNLPRPIVAGGTGAFSATGALANLGGEQALQVVANYDSFPFAPGSFYSAAGATSAPNPTWAFAGICYQLDNSNMFLEARSFQSGVVGGVPYVRQKSGGTWTGWVAQDQSTVDLVNDKVAKAGDTMTGALKINASPGLNVGSANPATDAVSIDKPGDVGLSLNTSGVRGWVVTKEVSVGNRFTIYCAPTSVYAVTIAPNGDTAIGSSTTSTSPTTGALVVNGGVGVAKNLVVGSSPLASATVAVSVAFDGLSAYGAAFRSVTNAGNTIVFVNSSNTQVGSISQTTTATAFNTSSDMRLKEGVETFDASRIVDDTEVFSFRWKGSGERAFGVSAQQAQEVFPQAVTYDKAQDWWGINYSAYVPIVLQELKALRLRVAELEKQLAVKPASVISSGHIGLSK